MKYKRILITGASGFIASQILNQALKEKWRTKLRVITKNKIKKLPNTIEQIVYKDIWKDELIKKATQDVDCIINCAGKLGLWQYSYDELFQSNVNTVQLIINNIPPKLKKFIHLSSPSVLGPSNNPQKPFVETDPLHPKNNYEITKSLSELIIQSKTDIPWVIIRPEFVYGPGDKQVLKLYSAIKNNKFAIIGNGDTYLHPTYISDVTNSIKLMLSPQINQQIFHIAGPHPLTVNDIVHNIRQIFGGNRPIHVPVKLARKSAQVFETLSHLGITPLLTNSQINFFTQHRTFSTKKAQKMLKWKPLVNYKSGLMKTYNWYLKNN